MSNSTILYERIWYLPTSLVDKSGRITLLGHIYRIKRTKSNNILLDNKVDGWEFDNESELATFIGKNKAVELPLEAEGQPRFVPTRIRNMVAKAKVSHE